MTTSHEGSKEYLLHCKAISDTNGTDPPAFRTRLPPMNAKPTEPRFADPAVIRKYANRRMYNTASGQFVTLADLQAMVRRGEDFVVREAKTDRDITVSVLAQIVAEEAGKGNNLLSSGYLRRLLHFYHEGLGDQVAAYLERSLEVFDANRRDLLRHLSNPFDPVGALATFRELGERNAEHFARLFTPGDGRPSSSVSPAARRARAAPDEGDAPGPEPQDEIRTLREQLASIQRRLDAIERERGG